MRKNKKREEIKKTQEPQRNAQEMKMKKKGNKGNNKSSLRKYTKREN